MAVNNNRPFHIRDVAVSELAELLTRKLFYSIARDSSSIPLACKIARDTKCTEQVVVIARFYVRYAPRYFHVPLKSFTL